MFVYCENNKLPVRFFSLHFLVFFVCYDVVVGHVMADVLLLLLLLLVAAVVCGCLCSNCSHSECCYGKRSSAHLSRMELITEWQWQKHALTIESELNTENRKRN